MLSLKGWVLIGGAGGSWVGGGDGCAGVGGGGWLRNSAAAGATAASFSPGQIKMGPNAWKFQPNQNSKTSFTFDLFKKSHDNHQTDMLVPFKIDFFQQFQF